MVVLPSGARSRIARIDGPDGERSHASAPLSVTVALTDDLDAGRGDLLAAPAGAPSPVRELSATVCWLGEQPARPGSRYLLKHTTRTVPAVLDTIGHRLDVRSLERSPAEALELNDIARVSLRTGGELLLDAYAESRATGAFILIDPASNDTVGAGMAG